METQQETKQLPPKSSCLPLLVYNTTSNHMAQRALAATVLGHKVFDRLGYFVGWTTYTGFGVVNFFKPEDLPQLPREIWSLILKFKTQNAEKDLKALIRQFKEDRRKLDRLRHWIHDSLSILERRSEAFETEIAMQMLLAKPLLE